MAKRSYSDAQRAEALAALDANGGNTKQTARGIGIPEATLRGWAHGENPVSADIRDGKKRGLLGELRDLAEALVSAARDKIKDANLQQTMTSLGIAIDKARLLEDLPTSIVREESGEETMARARKALESLRRWESSRDRNGS